MPEVHEYRCRYGIKTYLEYAGGDSLSLSFTIATSGDMSLTAVFEAWYLGIRM